MDERSVKTKKQTATRRGIQDFFAAGRYCLNRLAEILALRGVRASRSSPDGYVGWARFSWHQINKVVDSWSVGDSPLLGPSYLDRNSSKTTVGESCRPLGSETCSHLGEDGATAVRRE